MKGAQNLQNLGHGATTRVGFPGFAVFVEIERGYGSKTDNSSGFEVGGEGCECGAKGGGTEKRS